MKRKCHRFRWGKKNNHKNSFHAAATTLFRRRQIPYNYDPCTICYSRFVVVYGRNKWGRIHFSSDNFLSDRFFVVVDSSSLVV